MKPENKTKTLKAANIAVSVVLVLLVGFLLYYIGSASVASFAPSVITVSEVREYYEGEDIVVDISRPKVSGFSDKAFEKKLNKKIQNQISLNKSLAERFAWIKPHYISHTTFEVYYWVKSLEGIFSLKVTAYHGNGGSGMPLTSYYNVDIENNKLLTLDDLFTNGSYKERINKFITDVMIAQEYPSPELSESVSDKTKFFIMDGDLYITFSKYEITSGSGGEPEFRIPTEEIEDMLKEEYKGIFNMACCEF